MNGPVLVTGASGIVGGAILDALSSANVVVRQAVRNPQKARAGMEAVRFDYTDAATFAPALNGIRGVVLIAPPLDEQAHEKLAPVIAAAKNQGVEHIVLISAFGANLNEQAPLRIVEHLVIDSGVPYTILRPNFFMENFSQGAISGTIKDQNGIFVAAGDGKTSFISVRDIAAVVVAAFQTPLRGREFNLTGPEALDHTEVAKLIAAASGRPVVYRALTEEQMAEGLRAHGMPDSAISYLGMLYKIVRAGYAAGITPDVETVLGRKPMDFKTFADSVAAGWK